MIRIYHAPRTRSTRVIWLLEELGQPYEIVKVAFQPQPGRLFAQPTPSGKVPVLEDHGATLAESGAIVEYLLERYDDGRLAPAIGDPERGAFLQWLHFAESTAFAPVSTLVWLKRYRDDAAEHPELVADAAARAAAAFTVAEQALSEREYLLASGFSAADIMMGFTVFIARLFGIVNADNFPLLNAYYARLETRPAFQVSMQLD